MGSVENGAKEKATKAWKEGVGGESVIVAKVNDSYTQCERW